MTLGLICESEYDAKVVQTLIKRVLGDDSTPIRFPRGLDGSGDILSQGAKHISLLEAMGCTNFVICSDSDGQAWQDVHASLRQKVAVPSGTASKCVIAVAVQEIEAWLIADEVAVQKVMTGFRFAGHPNPETITSPKEWLRKQSQQSDKRPRYIPTVHNAKIALHLNTEVVRAKCKSFGRFCADLQAW